MNGHDISLLMVASDDGTIKVWKPMITLTKREPVLISAWQALTDMQLNKSARELLSRKKKYGQRSLNVHNAFQILRTVIERTYEA